MGEYPVIAGGTVTPNGCYGQGPQGGYSVGVFADGIVEN